MCLKYPRFSHIILLNMSRGPTPSSRSQIPVRGTPWWRQLSQVKEKEEYTSLEGYADGAGMQVQYAVANAGTSIAPPHSASASNIADLDIVMGSQVHVVQRHNRMKA